MKLNEVLKICLLALASRYPKCVVDVNEAVLGSLSSCSEACDPLLLIELLQINTPQLLDAHACLVVDEQRSEIYLVEQPEETPALWIYCNGLTPSEREKQLQGA